MTGEHQQPTDTKSTEEKKPGRLRSAARYAATAAVASAVTAGAIFGVNSGGSGETPRQQPAATSEMPAPGAAAPEASTAPQGVEKLPLTAELPPGFTAMTKVKTGDHLTRVNGILTLDVHDPKDGDSAHLTVANPVVRKINGQTQIGVQPVERVAPDGSVDHQAVPGTLAWVSTQPDGAIDGGEFHFSDVVGYNKNFTSQVKVLGSTSITTTQPDAYGNYSRTLIEASDSMSANSSEYNQTIAGGLNYQNYPQLESKVVATQLTEVEGHGNPNLSSFSMQYSIPVEQISQLPVTE